METIKGTLTKVTKDEGISEKSGAPYTRFVFVVDGKKYSTFNADLVSKVKLGQFVEMRGDQEGPYFNMKSIGPGQENGSYESKEIVPQETEVEVKPKPRDTGYHLTVEQQRVDALREANVIAKLQKGTPEELSNKEYYQLIRQNFEWISEGKL